MALYEYEGPFPFAVASDLGCNHTRFMVNIITAFQSFEVFAVLYFLYFFIRPISIPQSPDSVSLSFDQRANIVHGY